MTRVFQSVAHQRGHPLLAFGEVASTVPPTAMGNAGKGKFELVLVITTD
jgi:hypothetical protein